MIKLRMFVLFLVLGLSVSVAPVSAAEADIFTYDQLKQRASQLANAAFEDWRQEPPKEIRKLTYDQYRDIRFNPKKAIWRYEHIPFQVHLFHPGWIQSDQVEVYLIENGRVEKIPYSLDLFDFGTNGVANLPEEKMKFSGLRVHYPINRPDYLDELVVFQGATYFRALAKDLRYGLSARAVAVNCGGPGTEEFPRFRALWLNRPGDKDNTIRIFGLIDSPSLAGAAEFIITPGATTVMRNRVAIYARKKIAHLGIAPLTSMFWYGRQTGMRFSDFRPEVHDSDGLLMSNGAGEWLWRPLAHEGKFRFCSFVDKSPKGFGLFQRDRAFASYADLEAHYQDRPSAWVTPIGDWGEGSIRLLELPTVDEFNDNIVAFWEPKKQLAAGQSSEFAYEIQWFSENAKLPEVGRAVSTRIADIPDPEDKDRVADGKTVIRKFVLDFRWPEVSEDVASTNLLTASVDVQNATLLGKPVQQYNPYDRTWRLFFKASAPKDGSPVECRAFISRNAKPVTETWIYLWNP